MKFLAHPPFPFRLGVYTFGHFFVEFFANYFLIMVIGPYLISSQQMVTMLLVYNACDYGSQLLIGLADDIIRRNHYLAGVGPLLIILSFFIKGDPLVMAALLGLGAAFTHTPLGRQLLQDVRGRYTALSIFVSSGVLGVFLGRQVAFSHVIIWWQLMAISAFLTVLLALLGSKESQWNSRAEQVVKAQPTALNGTSRLAILALMITIVVQSFAMAVMVFQWSAGWLAWAEAFAIFLGKGAGGFLVDRFGYRPTVTVSLGIAIFLAGFSISLPAIGLIFLFAFNITGATIIARLPRLLPTTPGSAFGMYKLLHFLGFFPVLLFDAPVFHSPYLLIVLTLTVGLLMLWESRVPAVAQFEDQ